MFFKMKCWLDKSKWFWWVFFGLNVLLYVMPLQYMDFKNLSTMLAGYHIVISPYMVPKDFYAPGDPRFVWAVFSSIFVTLAYLGAMVFSFITAFKNKGKIPNICCLAIVIAWDIYICVVPNRYLGLVFYFALLLLLVQTFYLVLSIVYRGKTPLPVVEKIKPPKPPKEKKLSSKERIALLEQQVQDLQKHND